MATAAVATIVPTPGRISITTDWPFHRAVRNWQGCVTLSVGPPRPNGTMNSPAGTELGGGLRRGRAGRDPQEQQNCRDDVHWSHCMSSVPANCSSGLGKGKAATTRRDPHSSITRGQTTQRMSRLAAFVLSAKKSPGISRGEVTTINRRSHAIEDLVGPEALEALGDLLSVANSSVLIRQPGYRADVLLIEDRRCRALRGPFR